MTAHPTRKAQTPAKITLPNGRHPDMTMPLAATVGAMTVGGMCQPILSDHPRQLLIGDFFEFARN
jgi:hypothetical protein